MHPIETLLKCRIVQKVTVWPIVLRALLNLSQTGDGRNSRVTQILRFPNKKKKKEMKEREIERGEEGNLPQCQNGSLLGSSSCARLFLRGFLDART